MSKEIKLNIGAGGEVLEGFSSVDIRGGDYQIDVTEGLPFDNNCASYIRCHHFLEHIDRFQTLDVLKDIYRVLKPGGVLDIAVPDLEFAVSQYPGNKSLFKMMIFAGEGKPEFSSNPYQYHHSAFDKEDLTKELKEAGFEVGEISYGEYYGQELKVIATKL